MMRIVTCAAVFIVVLGVLGATPIVRAQENLDAGKSGAQVFTATCGLCHKLPEAVARAHGIWGLEGFLRDHYAASRESAANIANYLRNAENKQSPLRAGSINRRPDAKRKNRRTVRGQEARPKDTQEAEQKASQKSGAESASADSPKSDATQSKLDDAPKPENTSKTEKSDTEKPPSQ